jgi:hypothetical protein
MTDPTGLAHAARRYVRVEAIEAGERLKKQAAVAQFGGECLEHGGRLVSIMPEARGLARVVGAVSDAKLPGSVWSGRHADPL